MQYNNVKKHACKYWLCWFSISLIFSQKPSIKPYRRYCRKFFVHCGKKNRLVFELASPHDCMLFSPSLSLSISLSPSLLSLRTRYRAINFFPYRFHLISLCIQSSTLKCVAATSNLSRPSAISMRRIRRERKKQKKKKNENKKREKKAPAKTIQDDKYGLSFGIANVCVREFESDVLKGRWEHKNTGSCLCLIIHPCQTARCNFHRAPNKKNKKNARSN